MVSEMAVHEHEPVSGEGVFEQYEDLGQQRESYVVGMWTFLVTEVMFFGALFLAYALYRWQYQPAFYEVHKKLNVWMGGTNTVVLLFSSFTMALGVHFAMLKKRKQQLISLSITLLCAFTFLVIKYFEYKEKIDHHLLPGSNFQWHDSWVPANVAQLFFVLYFFMTGLHGIHVVAGILVIGTLMYMTWRKYPQVEDYIPTEMVGLYWHFVDLVWIFLFPLYYLIPR
jgi:cytochrome c oxidase subunit 3